MPSERGCVGGRCRHETVTLSDAESARKSTEKPVSSASQRSSATPDRLCRLEVTGSIPMGSKDVPEARAGRPQPRAARSIERPAANTAYADPGSPGLVGGSAEQVTEKVIRVISSAATDIGRGFVPSTLQPEGTDRRLTS